jgi:3-deoxy-D-manno-octulosonate 8-phosphate phosphatase (KDO 8-P phosphatase)
VVELKNIKWLILDVDGVMTDGRLIYSSQGEEYKVFNVKDGLGILNVRRLGVKVAVISGRGCQALKFRLDELGIDEIIMNRPDKGSAFKWLREKYGDSTLDSVCIGDDLPDLELFESCKVGVAVNDAVEEVKKAASILLNQKGGCGAVRELCDLLCKAG